MQSSIEHERFEHEGCRPPAHPLHCPVTPEFKGQMVDLVRDGRTPAPCHVSTGLAVRWDRQTLEFHPLVPHKDGHLFLSLMADGGVYEFEPSAAAKSKPVN